MLDRYSSDRYNPIFFKILLQTVKTPIIPVGLALMVLVNIGFFLAPLGSQQLGFAQKDADVFCIGAFNFIISALVAAIAYTQCIEFRKDGLDPTWGTRLTPWRIIAGQYSALALTIIIAQLFTVPALLSIEDFSVTSYFWSFIIFFAIGVFILSGGSAFNTATNQNSKGNTPGGMIGIAIAVIYFSFIVMFIANGISETSMNTKLEILLIYIPLMLLVVSYQYGSYLPLTMERFGLFRKFMLGLVAYMLPASFITTRLLFKEDDDFVSTSLIIFRISLLFLSMVYLLSSGMETMQPTFRRRLIVKKNPQLKYLSVPWQTGAVPGYILSMMISILIVLITPLSIFPTDDKTPLSVCLCPWILFPFMGLILLLRKYVRNKLQPIILIGLVAFAIFVVGIFSVARILQAILVFTQNAPYLFISINYIIGLALAYPAIRDYFDGMQME